MKSIYDMSGTERAAALLVAMGPDVAAEILKHLDEDSINTLSLEIARLDRLSVEDKENLIGEFLLGLRKNRKMLSGGENIAKDILVGAFGEEKAGGILKKLNRQNLEKGFDFLAGIDAEILTGFLQDEHPQTIAVALAYLPSAKSAEILQGLAPITAKDVAIRMARMEKTSPEAVLEIARVLRKKYEDSRLAGRDYEAAGGVDTLVEIISHMGGEQEKKLMDHFDRAIPAVSKEIRDRIFVFENVANLSNQEMRVLIDEIGNDYTIARALKGAGDELRFKFMRNMSRNRATDVLTEMDSMGPVRVSEIQESRDFIVGVMKDLNDNGMITIKKVKEKYVE
ncbi:MAG TPA: flagellar motor switch protein FliG [Spirochaetes bacterium]|nr:flagellar motor switch protein FliG [Spirochaetota bacterium]